MREGVRAAPVGWVACEFGVFTGRSLRELAQYRKGRIYGFDCWSGLPQAWDLGATKHEAGHFACERPRDLSSNTHLVDGLFADSIPRWLERENARIDFLHIDCDLYESTLDVLFLLNDRINPGAVILFDEVADFGSGEYTNWRDGEWRALVEWCRDFGREVKPIGRTAHQQAAFIVRQ